MKIIYNNILEGTYESKGGNAKLLVEKINPRWPIHYPTSDHHPWFHYYFQDAPIPDQIH